MIALANVNFDLSASSNTGWIWEVCIGLLAICILYSVASLWIKKASKQANHYKSSIKTILLLPLKILFIATAVYYSLSVLANRFGLDSFAEVAKPCLKAFLVLSMAWMAFRWKKSLIHSLQDNQKMSESGLSHTLNKVFSIFLFVLTVLVLLQVFQLDIWPVLAFGGIGAAAVGFAAKDVISNFCGGLMLSLTRPFVVGDQVIMPSLSLEGPVEEIGWYLTVVRDKDKRPVYLPNAIFSNALVINSSRMLYRRIVDEIHIRYTDFDKMLGVIAKIRVLLKEHSSVAADIAPIVRFNAFKESALCIYLDVYVTARQLPEYLEVKEQLYIGIYRILESEGIRPAYSRLTVMQE